MTAKRKQQIIALLKSIETGDEAPVAVVNPNQYIQHNPLTREGGEGLAVLFKRLAKTSPRVNIARIFSDGDYIFAHTEYDFSRSRVGFEIFRFEGDTTVEHWDNIQSRAEPNMSGHSMVDGVAVISDLDKTEENRQLVRDFVKQILISGSLDKLNNFVDANNYTEHNPYLADGAQALCLALAARFEQGVHIRYQTLHKLLAEGNFVLTVCEGYRYEKHTAFYDLYRLHQGKIVEHWDTIEEIPPRSEWVNENGKF